MKRFIMPFHWLKHSKEIPNSSSKNSYFILAEMKGKKREILKHMIFTSNTGLISTKYHMIFESKVFQSVGPYASQVTKRCFYRCENMAPNVIAEY